MTEICYKIGRKILFVNYDAKKSEGFGNYENCILYNVLLCFIYCIIKQKSLTV